MANRMFGSRLRFLRKSRQITQQQIADSIQISRSTYAGYENGSHEPDITIIRKIAEFYHISTDFLLSFDMQSVDPELDELRSQLWEEIASSDKETAQTILNLFKKLHKS